MFVFRTHPKKAHSPFLCWKFSIYLSYISRYFGKDFHLCNSKLEISIKVGIVGGNVDILRKLRYWLVQQYLTHTEVTNDLIYF